MNIQTLADFQSRYPLGPGWSDIEIHEESVLVGEHAIETVGLACTHADFGQVTGSAGQLGLKPYDRAYFELLERASIMLALRQSPDKLLSIVGPAENDIQTACLGDVFPLSARDALWQYSKSNGVAANTMRSAAIRSAIRETMERDTILRSWFGGPAPSRVSLSRMLIPISWQGDYRFQGAILGCDESAPFGCITAIAVGFPCHERAPLVFGFGARETVDDALFAATSECIQRLGFLWNVDLPSTPPTFAPTPDYHLEVFLLPDAVAKIANWLEGKNASNTKTQQLIRPPESWIFADLTPEHLADRFHVIKALNPARMPLVFGETPFECASSVAPELKIHPIA